ncbi:ATP-binding protein [Caulobacter mirabilis]|uniref:histidine kinase n=1 Tax=Caulobacter mirabilis TaxID=69666 RepID=A0A2D2ATH6_9CAUL|nr:ATP-binding protein [Caulobacter mirabilis]ATQ41322.1 hybrid sensor histidine kinase/response regulator [Caulobacter mirabilis]
MSDPLVTRPCTEIVLLRRRGLRSTLVLTLVAAAGGWVWLGLPFAALWAAIVLVQIGLNRFIAARLAAATTESGVRTEWLIAATTFVYTVTYCGLPAGLVVLGGSATAMVAGLAMIGAISLSSTSEFVISRRIGLASLSALALVTTAVVIARTMSEPLINIAFALIAVFGFFFGVLQFGMHRVRVDRTLRAAVAEAKTANAAKSVFLATMSHEIRTPLNGVLGMAQAMEAGRLDPIQRERLGIIREAGQALTNLLNDILDLSKIEAGKLELDDEPFELDVVLRAGAASFAAVAADKGLDLSVEISAEAAGLYRGDPARLRQVLANLVSNAVKFTDQGGVSVTATRDEGGLKLTVSDTGPGIAPNRLGQLFGKFAQLDASATRRHGGTGLGLAISRELCELMGGSITVDSEPGRGSAFIVTLPLKPIEATVPSASVADLAEAAGRFELRVLAAEDNAVNRLVLETLLAQAGIVPTTVEDGAAAVRAWAERPWDLILMDVHMPVLDGLGAVREIRAREAAEGRSRTPVIALTANAMTHQVAELLAAGMDRHVPKPIVATDLFAAIESVLAEPAMALPSDAA